MSNFGDSISAAVIDRPDADPRIQQFPVPTLKPGAALLKTLYSEICGTDVHIWRGKMPGVPFPVIPGHVSVGVLAEISGRVVDINGEPFREGDLVTFLDVHETCNNCWYCLVGKQTTRCPHRKVYGITYGVQDGLMGGWSEAIVLQPGVKIVRIPAGLDPETFIGGGCGLVTAIHAHDRADIQLGQRVVVLGVGPVGQSIIALAAKAGAGRVIAVGAPDERLEFAHKMGATDTISIELPLAERIERVHQLTGGRGADVVIEAAGPSAAVTDALEYARDGGRVVVAGQYSDSGDTSINPHRLINRKHIDVRGVWGSDYSHFHRAVEFAALWGREIPWREQVGGSYKLSQVKQGLEAVARREVVKALVVPEIE